MFEDLVSFEGGLWDEFQRLQREMDTLFGPVFGRPSIRAVARGSFPAINVGTTPDTVQIYMFAPGLDMNTLDLSLQRNVLTVAGERKVAAEPEGGAQAGYHLRERFDGAFRRVISLPEDVNPDQIGATYRNGVLTVSIGKQEVAKPRQIQVTNA
jgi:HSP20 family protein